MYSDLVNNLKDRAIDSVVDSTLTSFKDNQILNKTFVWTAVSKESYGGKIAYIIFVNKNMYRRSIQYNEVADFCANSYVSNLMVTDGKISLLGGNINDLPDVNSNHNRYNEQYIYNKALPYIQRTQNKIYEDFQNKCLRGVSNSEVHSDFSKNLSNVRDIAQAGAVTAMTVAGTAAVTGLTVGLTKAYKALNKKELLKTQIDIYNQINTCHTMVEGLINIKKLTNNYIQATPNITSYDINIELQNDGTGQFKNLIAQNGISGCIQRLENLINQGLAKADGHKLLDEPIVNKQGKQAGTLRAYGNSVKARIELLKQLHNKTEQLINANLTRFEMERQKESELRYLESQQGVIINDIRNQLDALALQLNNIEQKDVDTMNLDELNHNKNIIDNLDVVDITEGLKLQLSQVLDTTLRDELSNRVNIIVDSKNNLCNKIQMLINNLTIAEENSINSDMLQLSREVENVITGVYNARDYSEAYNTVRTKLSELKLRDKKGIHRQELSELENRIKVNEDTIKRNIRKANDVVLAVSKLEDKLRDADSSISLCKNASEIERQLRMFSTNISSSLSRIDDVELQEQCRNRIELKKTEYNNILTEMRHREDEAKNEVLADIHRASEVISSFDPSKATREDLDNFNIDTDSIKTKLNSLNLDYSQLSPVKREYEQMLSDYRKKRKDAEYILRQEELAMNAIEIELATITNKVLALEFRSQSQFNTDVNNIKNKIKLLKLNNRLRNIRDTSWFDRETTKLNQELEDKIRVLESQEK